MSPNDNETINETRSLLDKTNTSDVFGEEDENITASLGAQSNSYQKNGISWYFAVFLIVNAALGAGLLNFGKAYDNAGGILISSFIQLVTKRPIEYSTVTRSTHFLRFSF